MKIGELCLLLVETKSSHNPFVAKPGSDLVVPVDHRADQRRLLDHIFGVLPGFFPVPVANAMRDDIADVVDKLTDGADRINNVENVYLQSASAGTWIVTVEGYNTPYGPQPFALVVDGGGSGGVVVNVNFPNARNTDEARQAGSEIAAKAAAAAQRGMVRKGIG